MSAEESQNPSDRIIPKRRSGKFIAALGATLTIGGLSTVVWGFNEAGAATAVYHKYGDIDPCEYGPDNSGPCVEYREAQHEDDGMIQIVKDGGMLALIGAGTFFWAHWREREPKKTTAALPAAGEWDWSHISTEMAQLTQDYVRNEEPGPDVPREHI